MFVPNVPFRWEHRQPTETNTYCSGPRAHGSLRRRRNELHIASMEGLSMQRATPCPAPRDGGGKRVARLWAGETLMAQCSTPLRTSRAMSGGGEGRQMQHSITDIASAAKQSPGSVRQPKHSDIASAAKQSPSSGCQPRCSEIAASPSAPRNVRRRRRTPNAALHYGHRERSQAINRRG